MGALLIVAATLLSIAAKTYDALLVDLTAMSGGNSELVGETGADWCYISHSVGWGLYLADPTDGLTRKRSGGEQINPVLYSGNGGADPLPVVGNDSANATTFTADALDVNNSDDSAYSSASGLVATLSSSRLNAGMKWTFPVKTSLKTFWWLGWQYNGGWVASISISDASFATQTYSLPTGANFSEINAWWEAKWRGTADQVTAGVTVEVKVERTAIFNGQASAAIGNRAMVLLVPVAAPKPRGKLLGRNR